MKLTFSNIGKIKNAEIEIASITVVAGYNNTGKSTIGKVLFSIFNGLYNIEEITDKFIYIAIYNLLEKFLEDNGILLEYDSTVDIETTVNALLKLKNNLTKKAITTIVNDNLRQDFFEYKPDVDQI